MSSPLSAIALRLAYGATQLPRVAWYVGHGLAMRRLAVAARRRDGEGHQQANVHVPDRMQIYADMAVLLRRDLTNIEAGLYPLPADHDGSLLTLLQRSRLFFEDLPEIHRRRERGGHSEVLNEHPVGKRPRYYLQNFHFQSGGWMTDESARRYDTQVEVLFNGTANAIRRQALPQLREVFAKRDQRKLRLLDIGCGTGRFLGQVKQVWPRLPCIGLDLSEPDTSTAAGKCFGVFAEFETKLRRERQLEGIAKAKAAGVYKGRPASINAAKVHDLKAKGMGAYLGRNCAGCRDCCLKRASEVVPPHVLSLSRRRQRR